MFTGFLEFELDSTDSTYNHIHLIMGMELCNKNIVNNDKEAK